MRKNTEEELCRAFLDLLKKYPYTKITIQKIAGSCDMNRQTFYYHFDNIYDLMTSAFSENYEKVCPKTRGWGTEKAFCDFFHWMEDNRGIIRNLCVNAERETLRYVLYPLVYRTLTGERQTAGRIPAEIEYQEQFDRHFLAGAITQYAVEWADSDFRETPERIASRLTRFMERMDSGDRKTGRNGGTI